ncbi:hypothetical protein Mapa_010721 [Marchantia paleacea]|nr:hypothetical protein Mapa_010721 [Marchantia paleacea]
MKYNPAGPRHRNQQTVQGRKSRSATPNSPGGRPCNSVPLVTWIPSQHLKNSSPDRRSDFKT